MNKEHDNLPEEEVTEVETTLDDPTRPCPQGYIRNSKGQCVPDVG